MTKKYTIKFITIFLLAFSLSFVVAEKTLAVDVDEMIWGGYQSDFAEITGLGVNDPRKVIGDLINVALGFVGIIAFTIILLAGFKWMLASGNDDAIASAKGALINGLVGLVIVLSSFGIVDFLLKNLVNATTSF